MTARMLLSDWRWRLTFAIVGVLLLFSIMYASAVLFVTLRNGIAI